MLTIDSVIDGGETYDLAKRWAERKQEQEWNDEEYAMIPIIQCSGESLPSHHFTFHSYVLTLEFALFLLIKPESLRKGAAPGYGKSHDDDFVVKASKHLKIIEFVRHKLEKALTDPKFVASGREVSFFLTSI